MASENNNLIAIEDLEALGLDTTDPTTRAKAEAWIEYASNYIRLIAINNGVDLDTKLQIDVQGGGVYASVLKMVLANSVMRAASTIVEAPDATQFSQTASPYSETVHFAAGHNEAFFKKRELELLGFNSISGKGQFSVLRGVRG